MNIKELPIYMLSSFGHAGIDWTHSLLDNHSQILIMPAFSFFRTIYKLEKINKIDLKQFENSKYASKILTDLFYKDQAYNNTKRRQFIFNEEQREIFQNELEVFFEGSNDNIIKKLFYGIHIAYCKLHKIDLEKKKCIVMHEHVAWHYEKYNKYFKAKAILIFRDPKAVLGGGILRMKNSNLSKKINSFQMDTMILHMMSAFNIYLKEKKNNKIFSLQNEKMHINLILEMKKLCEWMNIEYENSLIKQTFLGNNWMGESSYLAVDELEELPPINYYDPQEVKKRWKTILLSNDILFIEVIFRKFIKEFNYPFENNINFFKIFCGYLNFFFRYQFQEKYFLNKYLITIRNIIRRICILIFKQKAANLFNFK
jgi:hypothetical protein